MGSLLARAKADAKKIITEGGFESTIDFESPLLVLASVKGLAMKHRISVEGEDQIINTKNVHITVAESSLTALSYPVRNAATEVALKGHKVTYTDSAGLSKTYIIDETYPDETIGIIMCTLKDFE